MGVGVRAGCPPYPASDLRVAGKEVESRGSQALGAASHCSGVLAGKRVTGHREPTLT